MRLVRLFNEVQVQHCDAPVHHSTMVMFLDVRKFYQGNGTNSYVTI
jgi:hypothetical protein